MRLLKVIVAPALVSDDGEFLHEQPVSPAVVPAAGWDEYAARGFADTITHIEQQLGERLRIVKVDVKVVFIVDDGAHLSEQAVELSVAADQWQTFVETTFAELVKQAGQKTAPPRKGSGTPRKSAARARGKSKPQ